MEENSFVLPRRTFLKVCGAAGLTLLTGGIGIGLKQLEADEKEKPEKIVPTCGRNNCGGRCVIKAHVKDGMVVRITSDTDDQPDFPSLRACVRGRSYRKTFFSPDRLKYPMKRVGERGEGKFERISWEEAIETIAKETKRIKEQYGPASRYVNYASGNQGVVRGDRLMRRLLSLDDGHLEFYGSYSSITTSYMTPYIYGDSASGSSYDTWADSKLIILFSFNPVETIHGTLTPYYLKKAKEAGAKIIVVDPRCTDTAVALADEWIAIRPTTDGALLAAMAYVILTENLLDRHFLDTYCIGFDRAHMPAGYEDQETEEEYLLGIRDQQPKTPEWAEAICGVPAARIRQLAIEYATAKPAAMVQGYGIQRNANGECGVRMGALLPAMTGNIGISGGWAGGHGGWSREKGPSLPMPKNPVKAKISCFLWTDAILRGKEMTKEKDHIQGVDQLDANIKAIYNIAGNTLINQHSDCGRTAEILKDTSKVEFIVVSDLFMTPSAKFADILLPSTSPMESDNIATAWWGDYTLFCNRAVEPMFECRDDYDWILEVAEKLGLKDKFSEGHQNAMEWCEAIYDNWRKKEPELPSFAEFKEKGGYKFHNRPKKIAYEAQIKDPIGHPFKTPSGKIELFSERMLQFGDPQEIPALAKYVPAFEGPQDPLREKYPLQCMGWHYKRRCHSMHDQNPWLEEIGPQLMWMNPLDAKERNIQEGDTVEVFNDRGRVRIPVHVTSRIFPGVVAIPQGAWYTPDKNGIDVRGCINTLTTQRPTPIAKGNPQHTNLVEVKLA
ncbi:DMSO/selenate family reductase complex A subunit [Selenomonas sp.]|uniref:DMSO/selenate family reductase complex A subunit n=1 Tax=Selenomonas sp. TaxID=2053611 RepID=UPI0025EB98BA|nr:DMSO/selenate family reductase complex A subunit [Selenomonas sp.]